MASIRPEISLATESYETRLVAYIDILGFRNFVNATRPAYGSSKLEEFFSYFKKQITDGVRALGRPGGYLPSFTIFSDSIVIAYPLDLFDFHSRLGNLRPAKVTYKKEWNQDRQMLLMTVSSTIVHIQDYCLKFGLLLRGAIAIDEIYVNENVWFGPGLNSAYEHESHIAKFPRVILTSKASAFFQPEIHNIDGTTNFVTCDTDGYYFITPFYWVPNDPNVDDHGQEFRQIIEANLLQAKADSRLEHHQKWQWLAKRFNAHLEKRDTAREVITPIEID